MFAKGFSLCIHTVAAATVIAVPALAAPSATAAPASDGQGYVDSTARCPSTDATVLFGSTDLSRIAICEVSGGTYEYRGVRLRDGAKLIIPATRSDDGAFLAENAGVEYLVTAKSLVVSTGENVIREEEMVDFHGPDSGSAASAPKSTTPTTPLPPPLPAEVGGSAAESTG
ncbi:hypothetical protein [Mycolicibacterium goodii]|uniref:hypothetical protein n=1 Tax=Mycolicibacterium goodii TaxID=134601 RepID=UPI000C25BA4F|nr:hypothetical protein [Mycolicibacterium goodii]PJK23588.1 hypothetical protein CSX11_04620 [Mycolicibacterium goodii]